METENTYHHRGRTAVKITGIIVLGIIILGSVFQKNFLPSEDTISVVGQGKVPVKLDGAIINLGVTTMKAATPEDALQQTSAKVEKIKSIFAEMQIPETDWQITAYAFDPQYETVAGDGADASSTTKLDGYNGFQRITVKLNGIDKDPKAVDNFIQRMVAEGVNKVGAVKFVASNIEALKQEAREKSIQAAKDKAAEYQSKAGVKLMGISNVSENEIAVPPDTQNNYYDNNPITFNGSVDQVTLNQAIDYQAEVIIETTLDYHVK